MPILVMKYVFLNIQKNSPWIIKPIVNGIVDKVNGLFLGPNIRTHVEFLESELGKRRWLAGEEYSGADIQVIIFEIYKKSNHCPILFYSRRVLLLKC